MTDEQIRRIVETSADMARISLPSNWREEYDRIVVLYVDYDGGYQFAKDADGRAVIAKTKAVLDMAKGDGYD